MQRNRRNSLSPHSTVGTQRRQQRRALIARGIMSLAAVVLLTGMLPSPAGAGVDLGQFCWRLDPFVDTLRLSITAAIGAAPLFELHGRWRATATAGQRAAGGAGPATYQLLGAGAATESLTQPGNIDLALEAVHNTTFFGGNHGCNVYAAINPLSLNGTWTLQCPGPTLFTTQGTLTFVLPFPGNF